MITLDLADTLATEKLGVRLFQCLPAKCLVFLHGDLGMGKTTLVRGFLQAAGHVGVVKSPTYNIVEEYSVHDRQILHFDLYRIVDPEELEWIGMRDYLAQNCCSFIEWPVRGGGYLPRPDLEIHFRPQSTGRVAELTLLNPELLRATESELRDVKWWDF